MLTSDPALVVKVSRESEYYQLQSEPLRSTWSFLAYVVSSVMALGAMFAAANTMYSAVSARRAEIATLRAVGFEGLAGSSRASVKFRYATGQPPMHQYPG